MDTRSGFEFVGGEDAGLQRCDEYINQSQALLTYADTRNGLMGAHYSSKFSPWLANGSLSIRHVYQQTRKFEAHVKKTDSTTHFVHELFWRDFCYFFCERHGTRVFQPYGVFNKGASKWHTDPAIVKRWKDGMTGMPLIDALMRELNTTGFMGNRGR